METTRITTKGQITLPVKIRKELHLNTGDSVYFEKQGNNYILRPYVENFEDIKTAAEKLGLESMSDVKQLLDKLSVSYEQAKNGQTIDADTFFRELLNE